MRLMIDGSRPLGNVTVLDGVSLALEGEFCVIVGNGDATPA